MRMLNGDLCGTQRFEIFVLTDNLTLQVQFHDKNDPTYPRTLNGEDVLLLREVSRQRVEPKVAYFQHQNPTLHTRHMPSHLRDSKTTFF